MLTDTDRLCHAIAEEARIQAWLYVNAQIEDTDCALMADHVITLRAAELAQGAQEVQPVNAVLTPGPNATAPYAVLPADDDGRIAIVYVPHGTHRATTYDPSFAALAVRACNAHDALVVALERALLELSAIEHGLLGPEHAARRNGCAAAALECRAALREVQP